MKASAGRQARCTRVLALEPAFQVLKKEKWKMDG